MANEMPGYSEHPRETVPVKCILLYNTDECLYQISSYVPWNMLWSFYPTDIKLCYADMWIETEDDGEKTIVCEVETEDGIAFLKALLMFGADSSDETVKTIIDQMYNTYRLDNSNLGNDVILTTEEHK